MNKRCRKLIGLLLCLVFTITMSGTVCAETEEPAPVQETVSSAAENTPDPALASTDDLSAPVGEVLPRDESVSADDIPAGNDSEAVVEAPVRDGIEPAEEAPVRDGSEPADEAPVRDGSKPAEEAPVSDGSEPAEEAQVNDDTAPAEPGTGENDTAPSEAASDYDGSGSSGATPMKDDPVTVSGGESVGEPVFSEDFELDANDAAADASSTGFDRTEDGKYILSGYQGNEEIRNSGGAVTILTAGLNHISCISAKTIHVAGTGILLVDKLKGKLDLLTFTDLYKEGSAAVFVKQKNGTYLLVNGSVPGILDEEYVLEDVALVVPAESRLIISSIGAIYDPDTGKTVYYSGTQHKVGRTSDHQTVVESAGQLTIAGNASLKVSKGADIVLSKLKSTRIDGEILPALKVVENGILKVSGQVSGGTVQIASTAQLQGSGKIKSDQIVVDSPEALDKSQVTMSSKNLELNGSGTLKVLRILNSNVYVTDSALEFSRITADGNNMIKLPARANLHDIVINGTLHLRTGAYMCRRSDGAVSTWRDEDACTIDGLISGSGKLCLDSGIYVFRKGTRLKGTSVKTSGAIAYDYAGLKAYRASSPWLPEDRVPVPAMKSEGQEAEIALWGGILTETNERDGSKRVSTDKIVDLGQSAVTAKRNTDGTLYLDAGNLRSLADKIRSAQGEEGKPVVVELFSKTSDGALHSFIGFLDDAGDQISAEGVFLVRLLGLDNLEPVHGGDAMTTTNTSFTGTGILGGSNAGSVRYGKTEKEKEKDKEKEKKEKHSGEEDSLTESAQQSGLRVEVEPVEEESAGSGTTESDAKLKRYVLSVYKGSTPVLDLKGQSVEAVMDFVILEDWDSESVYAVFRNEDGSLSAFAVFRDEETGTLIFETDRVGEFVLVSYPYDGELFSEEFYRGLEELLTAQEP